MRRLHILLLFIWLPICLAAHGQKKVVLVTGGSKGIGFEIAQLLSKAGFEPFPLTEGYGASNFALEGLSESLAVYLDKWNIQVTLIEPAGVKTTMALDPPLGKRFLEETRCFTKFCAEGKKALETSIEDNQSPKEIALLVSRILKEKHPHLRYQTNGIASAMAMSRFIDPSGDSPITSKKCKQQALLKMLDES